MNEIILFTIVIIILLFTKPVLNLLKPKHRLLVITILFFAVIAGLWTEPAMKIGFKIPATLLCAIALFQLYWKNYKLLKS